MAKPRGLPGPPQARTNRLRRRFVHLLGGGLVQLLQPAALDRERKRFYQLTRSGRTALLNETERLAALVKVARARLKRAGGMP